MSDVIQQRVDRVWCDGDWRTVKYAYANVNASQTGSSLVAAVAGKSIYVLAIAMSCAGTATTSTFNSASTAISGLFTNGVNVTTTLGYNTVGWFKTAAGEALTVTTGAGTATGYNIVYIEA